MVMMGGRRHVGLVGGRSGGWSREARRRRLAISISQARGGFLGRQTVVGVMWFWPWLLGRALERPGHHVPPGRNRHLGRAGAAPRARLGKALGKGVDIDVIAADLLA